jgi:SnoaL-like polyketide cyclase
MVDISAADITTRALALWGQPVPDGQGGIDAFRALYTEPVTVNGTDTDLGVLVDRARMLQGALSDLHHDVHEVVATPGRRAFAFTITGRHTGPLTTPLGEVPASGAAVAVTGLDIFTVDEDADRVTAIWAVADWLGLLVQAGAVSPLE